MRHYFGKRILFTLGGNDAIRTSCVQMISPNGLFVRLDGGSQIDEVIGWHRVDDVTILDVLGDERDSLVQMMTRSHQLGL